MPVLVNKKKTSPKRFLMTQSSITDDIYDIDIYIKLI